MNSHSPVLSLNRFDLSTWLGLGLVTTGVVLFFIVNSVIVPQLSITLIENETLNSMLLYQSIMLLITVLFLVCLYILRRDAFLRFVRIGEIKAQPVPVKWLDIKASETWGAVGRNFTIIVSVATVIFMLLSIEGDVSSLNFTYFGFVLLFSLTNSFIEEAITRLGVVVSLHEIMPAAQIAIVSGLIFGIPHFSVYPAASSEG